MSRGPCKEHNRRCEQRPWLRHHWTTDARKGTQGLECTMRSRCPLVLVTRLLKPILGTDKRAKTYMGLADKHDRLAAGPRRVRKSALRVRRLVRIRREEVVQPCTREFTAART